MLLSARRVVTLAEHLPSDAALYGSWGVRDELAAQTVEMLDAVRIQVAATTGNKKVKRWKRLDVPRPESVRPKKKGSWVQFAKDLARKVGG